VADAYRDIVEFERVLADDGAAILKFFLHISKKSSGSGSRPSKRTRWKPGA